MTITLVGNKVDGATAQRQVSEEEGLRFARENGLLYVETSAMTSANVDNAFIETARVICNKIEEGYLDPTNEINGVKIGYMPGGRHHHHHDQNREGDSRSGSVTIEDAEKERATGGTWVPSQSVVERKNEIERLIDRVEYESYHSTTRK